MKLKTNDNGTLYKQFIKSQGISVKDLAKELGIWDSHLSYCLGIGELEERHVFKMLRYAKRLNEERMQKANEAKVEDFINI